MGSYVDPWDLVCLVPGCGFDLSGLSKYHHRHRVCQQHLKASSAVLADGDEHRFCQQCGRFQPVSEFNGARRSCQAGLHAHNERRRNCYVEPEGAPPEQAQRSKKARSQEPSSAAPAAPEAHVLSTSSSSVDAPAAPSPHGSGGGSTSSSPEAHTPGAVRAAVDVGGQEGLRLLHASSSTSAALLSGIAQSGMWAQHLQHTACVNRAASGMAASPELALGQHLQPGGGRSPLEPGAGPTGQPRSGEPAAANRASQTLGSGDARHTAALRSVGQPGAALASLVPASAPFLPAVHAAPPQLSAMPQPKGVCWATPALSAPAQQQQSASKWFSQRVSYYSGTATGTAASPASESNSAFSAGSVVGRVSVPLQQQPLAAHAPSAAAAWPACADACTSGSPRLAAAAAAAGPAPGPAAAAAGVQLASSVVCAAAAGASPTVVDAATVDPQFTTYEICGLLGDVDDLATPAEEDLASEDVDAFLDGALQRLFNTQPDMVLAMCSAE